MHLPHCRRLSVLGRLCSEPPSTVGLETVWERFYELSQVGGRGGLAARAGKLAGGHAGWQPQPSRSSPPRPPRPRPCLPVPTQVEPNLQHTYSSIERAGRPG